MHPESYNIMKSFIDNFVDSNHMVLDVGSRDVNGSYKNLFFGNNYVGLDVIEGKNVDVVVDEYSWPFQDESFDIVISGQAFEHIEFFWKTIEEMVRVLKVGGKVCIIAPAEEGKHRYPIDCWRFMSDGMRAIAKWSELEIIDTKTTKHKNRFIYADKKKRRNQMQDSVLIAKKVKKTKNPVININDFHRIFYDSLKGKDFVRWQGVGTKKYPNDLIIYQNIIYSHKPDFIIELGTYKGGSALFFANMMDLNNKGEVITVDVKKRKTPEHDRITYLNGSSLDLDVVDKIKSIIHGDVMVVIDSVHTKEHVLKEIMAYKDLVTENQYMVVEDTCLGYGIPNIFGSSPMEAVEEFLSDNNDFSVIRSCEKYLITTNPKGWLRRNG